MNDLGDVETWAKRVQAEMKTIASSLEYVTKVEDRNSNNNDNNNTDDNNVSDTI